jgi:pimeloyl-ACP methyl ester carboxylesterase
MDSTGVVIADWAARLRVARITATVQRPEWGGVARLHCHQWRLAEWAGLPEAAVRHVVYIPGLMADFTPDAPIVLLQAAAACGMQVAATVVDLPEYAGSRLPPGWARRMARATSLVDDAQLLQALLEQVAPARYTLVGGSVGANLATILAALAPDQVEAIQLCMPAGFYARPVVTGLIPGVLLTLLQGLRTSGHRELALRQQTFAAIFELLGSLGKLPVTLQAIRLLARANALPFAAQVRCPVVIALGGRDVVFGHLVPMYRNGALAACFPQATSVRVHVLPDADHNGFASHRSDLAAITLDLLRET